VFYKNSLVESPKSLRSLPALHPNNLPKTIILRFGISAMNTLKVNKELNVAELQTLLDKSENKTASATAQPLRTASASALIILAQEYTLLHRQHID
jgi:hypothetical protein